MSSLVTEDGRRIEDLRVVDLREELDKRGLSKIGKKQELYERLKDAMLSDAPAAKEEEEAAAPEEPVNPMIAEYLAKKEKKMQEQQLTTDSTDDGHASKEKEDDTKTEEVAEEEEKSQDEKVEAENETSKEEEAEEAGASEAKDGGEDGHEDKKETEEVVEEEAPMAEEEAPSPTHSPSPTSPSSAPAPIPSPKVEEIKADEPAETAIQPEAKEEPGIQRKRKWGSTSATKSKVAIDSEVLKDMGLPSTTEAVKEEEETEPIVVAATAAGDELELDYEESGAPPPTDTAPPPPKRNRIVLSQEREGSPVRKVMTKGDPASTLLEMVTEEGLVRAKSLTPPRHEASTVVQVRGLTRPFTLLQLHALLGAYGSYSKDTDFWIDGIKSHCIVRFASEEEARAARDGLHNVRWPQGNPKMLRADFATADKLEKMMEESKPVPRARADAGREMVELQPVERPSDRTGERMERIQRTIHRDRPSSREEERGMREERRVEVDRRRGRRERSEEVEDGGRGRSRATRSPPKPVKTLEDLFRKTKTLPCLYWLPLSDEAEMEARAVRRAEDLKIQKERKLRHGEDYPPPSWNRAPPRDDPWGHQRSGWNSGGSWGGGWGGGGGYGGGWRR